VRLFQLSHLQLHFGTSSTSLPITAFISKDRSEGEGKDTMILYNTIVGLAAGAGLLGVAQLLKQFANGEKVQPEGFVLTFGMTGFIQTVLGLTISVMWPYTKVLASDSF